ncbi:hypothetical protein [Bradyrhizobium sp. WSM1743]|nr:hypothetical protein [Bradyrhizobium sp. WSM1743]
MQCDFAGVDHTNKADRHTFVQECGFTMRTKLWIAEFVLPAPARIRAALD